MAFAEELFAAAQPAPIETNPFVMQVRGGEATRESIRAFALLLAAAADSFSRSLFAVLGVCTDVRVRESLIGNVLEEEGATGFVPGSGATFDPARRHSTMARAFTRAAGVEDGEVDALRVEPPNWFQRQIRAGDWVGPFAYIAVGTEANIPPTYRLLIPALAEKYGFSERDLAFLIEHVTADDRHGLDGATLIESVARTDAARRQALEGARRGGRGWWEILRQSSRKPTFILT